MDTEHAKRQGERRFNHRGGHRNRGWNVMSRRKREAAPASRKVITPPLMHAMKYTVPSVLVFARCQALHPASMWCFVAATCVYWLIAGEMKRTPPPLPTRFRIYKGTAVASVILSGAGLVSMLLSRHVPVWIPLSAGVILYAAFCLIYGGIKFAVDRMHAPVVESPSTLPV